MREHDEHLQRAADALSEGAGEDSVRLIRDAVRYASEAHLGQTRASGEPYISHPIAVATIVRRETKDPESIAAAVLHDVVEDTATTLDALRERFGDTIAKLVDGVTKVDLVGESRSRRSPEAAQRLMLATAGDLRVLIIKLSDRLHNMRTIRHLSADKQKRISEETRALHLPLAGRIGALRIQDELAEHTFRVLEPGAHTELSKRIAERTSDLEEAKERLLHSMPAALRERGLEGFELSVRIKSPHSVHAKMIQSGRRFEHVHDLLAVRIVLQDEKDCYTALGAVHGTYPPVAGRFADHIALPKRNLYQSLHTTILVGAELTAETQIRTEAMHTRAEHGFAAHRRYKQGDAAASAHLREMAEDTEELTRMLILELSEDEVTVFTPKGQVVQLPAAATPLDLAYTLHSEIGDHAVGATADGTPIDLAGKLPTGSTVRIIVDPTRKPSVRSSWLEAVRTAKASRALRARKRAEGPSDPRPWERGLVRTGAEDKDLPRRIENAVLLSGATSAQDLEQQVREGNITPEELHDLLSPEQSV